MRFFLSKNVISLANDIIFLLMLLQFRFILFEINHVEMFCLPVLVFILKTHLQAIHMRFYDR